MNDNFRGKKKEIKSMEEEIKSVKSDGKKIYEMINDVIKEFGYQDLNWMEQIKMNISFGILSEIIPLISNETTALSTKHNGKGIKITTEYPFSSIKIYYDDKLVFSGCKRSKNFSSSEIIIDKIILCKWVDKIKDLSKKVKKKRRKREMKEEKEKIVEKKKNYRKECEVKI